MRLGRTLSRSTCEVGRTPSCTSRRRVGVSSCGFAPRFGFAYLNAGTATDSGSTSADDGDGYYGTGNSSSSDANQKRTLTLSNGHVIWDLAGNAYEWTQGTSTNNQPGVLGAGYAYRQWTVLTTQGSLTPSSFPATTGIAGASSWTSGNGIGQVYSSADETALRAFLRGGSRDNGGGAGVLMVYLMYGPSTNAPYICFRVSR